MVVVGEEVVVGTVASSVEEELVTSLKVELRGSSDVDTSESIGKREGTTVVVNNSAVEVVDQVAKEELVVLRRDVVVSSTVDFDVAAAVTLAVVVDSVGAAEVVARLDETNLIVAWEPVVKGSVAAAVTLAVVVSRLDEVVGREPVVDVSVAAAVTLSVVVGSVDGADVVSRLDVEVAREPVVDGSVVADVTFVVVVDDSVGAAEVVLRLNDVVAREPVVDGSVAAAATLVVVGEVVGWLDKSVDFSVAAGDVLVPDDTTTVVDGDGVTKLWLLIEPPVRPLFIGSTCATSADGLAVPKT
jgi:hypothetical protein